jgi:hypothetical protein
LGAGLLHCLLVFRPLLAAVSKLRLDLGSLLLLCLLFCFLLSRSLLSLL